jgi:hypothetical protein
MSVPATGTAAARTVVADAPPTLRSLNERAAATAAISGGATETMGANANDVVMQTFGVKLPQVTLMTRAERQIEHLVEVAVVNAPLPVDAQQVTTHEPRYGINVEVLDQQPLIRLTLPSPIQIVREAVDRQVGKRQ